MRLYSETEKRPVADLFQIQCNISSSRPTMIANQPLHVLTLIALAGLYAGLQNALAGGGSFVTFPALLLAGLNPLAANLSSTIALFPSQIANALGGRRLAGGVGNVPFRHLLIVSLIGGIAGALLLLSTTVSVFTNLVPWLVLFATVAFAWGSFVFKPHPDPSKAPLPNAVVLLIQGLISVYGGYFGGGIGFLMLAVLTIGGQQVRTANATKNGLVMAINASAVAIFAFSAMVNWAAVLALGLGAMVGAMMGTWLIVRLPEKVLRAFIVLIGAVLTVWLFVRA